MTYISFWLEAVAVGSGQKRYKHDLPQVPGRSFGPYDLQVWAKRQGLEIEYLDNCFVKVTVPRQRLINLLSELYGSQACFQEVIPSIVPGWEYTLVAEEF